MKKETIKIEWSCDICGKNTNSSDIHTCIVPVLQSGHHDEYGGRHEVQSKVWKMTTLDLCKRCLNRSHDEVIKQYSQMFTSDMTYTFSKVNKECGVE